MQAPPAKRSGKFDWANCTSDISEVVATRIVSAGYPYTSIAFELACVNKELATAVKRAVGKELRSIQSLYEDYRKMVLVGEKRGAESPSQKVLFCELAFSLLHIMGVKANNYLDDLLKLHKCQRECAKLHDSEQYVMTKFGFTFEDHTLAAHMCRGVCMMSSSVSTLGNWVAKSLGSEVKLQFPFGQQVRVACVNPEYYKQQTFKYDTGKPLKACGDVTVFEALVRRHNINRGSNWDPPTSPLSMLRVCKALASPVGFYKTPTMKHQWVELPFFPSAFVPRSFSLAGRLDLLDVHIEAVQEDVKRRKDADLDERDAVERIRLRRFNADASEWLRSKGLVCSVGEVCELLGEDVAGCWTQTAASLVHADRKVHPMEIWKTRHMLMLMCHQMQMRSLVMRLTGEALWGERLASTTVELSDPPLQTVSLMHGAHIVPLCLVDPLAVAVEFVLERLRSGQARLSMDGTSCDDLRWSINLGSGFTIQQKIIGTDIDDRLRSERINGQSIRDIFNYCHNVLNATTECPSLLKISRARLLLCKLANKGAREKDRGEELLGAIKNLLAETSASRVGRTLMFPLFSIGKDDIRYGLEDLHEKWKSMQCPDLPTKCPLTTRDFVLELLGNPKRLPVSYLRRPPPKPPQPSAEAIAQREQREAATQAVLAQIPEMQVSDSEDEGDGGDGGDGGYSPTSPAYSPTSPAYSA